jgi:type III secretion system YscQ/HrcQ family protein
MHHHGSLAIKKRTDPGMGPLCHRLPVTVCEIKPSPNALPVGSLATPLISRKAVRRFGTDLPSPGFKRRPFVTRGRKPLAELFDRFEDHLHDVDPLRSDALPAIHGWAVPLLNTIFCANSTVAFNLNKAEYAFIFEPEAEYAQPVKYTPEMMATLVANNHRFSIGLEHLNFIGALDGVNSHQLPPQIQSAFFEAWFGSIFEKLEQWRGTRIHVDALKWRPDISEHHGYNLYFCLCRQSDQLEAKGHVSMGTKAMQWLAEGFAQKRNNGNFPGIEQLPFELGFEIGWMHIGTDDFRRLKSNDILLLDKCTLNNRASRVLVRLAHGPCWVGNIDHDTITISAAGEIPMGNENDTPKTAPQRRVDAAGQQGAEETTANQENNAAGSGKNSQEAPKNQIQEEMLAAAVIEGLHVDLVFEVGRRKITLQELKKIKPGYVFDLATPLEHSISVVANGRTVGKGTLVQIDQRIGVRLVEIIT